MRKIRNVWNTYGDDISVLLVFIVLMVVIVFLVDRALYIQLGE